MKDIIIGMLIIVGLSTFFVKYEKSFYSWLNWCGFFVAIRLLIFCICGG